MYLEPRYLLLNVWTEISALGGVYGVWSTCALQPSVEE